MGDLHVQIAGPEGVSVNLLFLHGMGLDHTYFRPFVDPLARRHRLVFFDHRLNGRSARHADSAVTVESMAADAVGVLDAAGASTAVAVAHSWGPWVALAMARNHPSRLTGMILVAPVLSGTAGSTLMEHVAAAGTPAHRQALAHAFTGGIQSDEELRRVWRDIMPLYFARPDPDVIQAVLGRMSPSAAGFNQFVASGPGSISWEATLAAFDGPVLVVAGEKDWMEKDAEGASAAIVQAARHGSRVVLPDCGHFPFIEAPVPFVTEVERWLAANAEG